MKRMGSAYIALFLAVLSGCDSGGDGGRDGKVVTNTARLEKSVGGEALRLVGTVALRSSRAAQTDDDGKYRSTPEDLSGDLCYAILSLGDLGPGMFGMVWLAPEETFPNGPSSGTMANIAFALSNPTNISGYVVVPESADAMPDRREIIRAELSFNYVDARVNLGDAEEEYTIRTVYATTAEADDTDGTMMRGDKLIKLPGESVFQWADANGLHAERPVTGAYRDATVVDAVYPGDGNPDYVPVTANFTAPLPVSYDLITDESRIWTLTFDLSDAVLWGEVDPDTLTDTPEALVDAFRLKFGPNQSTTYGEEDDGIRAALTIE